MPEIAASAVRGLWLCAVTGTLTACDVPTEPVAAARPQGLAITAPDRVAAQLGRSAVNALVVPLLDDAEPPRFTTVALPFLCADASEVSVDGLAIVDGSEVPPGSFTVQWRLRSYCPFGEAGPELDGDIDVIVLRDDEAGWQALVMPPRRSQLARSLR